MRGTSTPEKMMKLILDKKGVSIDTETVVQLPHSF